MGLHELAPRAHHERFAIVPTSSHAVHDPARSCLIGFPLPPRAVRRSFPYSPGRAERKGKPDGKISRCDE